MKEKEKEGMADLIGKNVDFARGNRVGVADRELFTIETLNLKIHAYDGIKESDLRL